mmetsp:Transcript_32210/g.75905  ORF Transcript_32210/g.75905 Transcript_32210/m.75905 type:complete len:208 (+) Transcript_32210:65-688(+)
MSTANVVGMCATQIAVTDFVFRVFFFPACFASCLERVPAFAMPLPSATSTADSTKPFDGSAQAVVVSKAEAGLLFLQQSSSATSAKAATSTSDFLSHSTAVATLVAISDTSFAETGTDAKHSLKFEPFGALVSIPNLGIEPFSLALGGTAAMNCSASSAERKMRRACVGFCRRIMRMSSGLMPTVFAQKVFKCGHSTARSSEYACTM